MVLCVSRGSSNIYADVLKTLQVSDFLPLHFHVEMKVEKEKMYVKRNHIGNILLRTHFIYSFDKHILNMLCERHCMRLWFHNSK